MNLQGLIKNVDPSKLAEACVIKHAAPPSEKLKEEDIDKLFALYLQAILNVSICEPESSKYTISVVEIEEEDEDNWFDVCLANPDYVAPPEEAKPWGCTKGEEAPEGYFNANDSKYSKYFSASFVPWKEMAGMDVDLSLKKEGMPIEAFLAEIVWEMTFYGFDEESMNEERSKLEDALKEVEELRSSESICEPDEDK